MELLQLEYSVFVLVVVVQNMIVVVLVVVAFLLVDSVFSYL